MIISKKGIHLGIGHFGIGSADGVNMVIARNVQGLLNQVPDIKISLFGKLSRNIHQYLNPIPGRLEYIDIKEFDPDYPVKGFKGRDIDRQRVQDYIWHGSNIANLKKFHSPTHSVPGWHEMIYPDFENLHFITINTSDMDRLKEHGVTGERIRYLPNSLSSWPHPHDFEYLNVRKKIIKDKGLDPNVNFMFYPVRCIRRKNVEEAVFLTCFFNRMQEKRRERRRDLRIEGKYHLLVGLKPSSGDDKLYADTIIKFCNDNNLPVTIGIEEYAGSEREYDPEDPARITKFSVNDIYRMSEMVITTSWLEGFGFVYIEPWHIGTAVIGRDLPLVTENFNRAGMNLGHLYRVLQLDNVDYKDLGAELGPQQGLLKRLDMILKLDDVKFVRRLQDRNEAALTTTLKLFNREFRDKIINHNKKVVSDTYSQDLVARRFYDIINNRSNGSEE